MTGKFEGFEAPYGRIPGSDQSKEVLDEVRYGAAGSSPVVEGRDPEGYTPFTYPDALPQDAATQTLNADDLAPDLVEWLAKKIESEKHD